MSMKSQQKAVAAHTARLIASGGSRVTLKLSPAATAVLNALEKQYGSRTKAIEKVLTNLSDKSNNATV